MVNFLISFLKYSHLRCLSVIFSWSSIRRVSEIWFFIFSTYSAFEVKELLNFQKPFPWVGIRFSCKEKNIGEWSVQKEARMSVFRIGSCSILESRKKSSLRSAKPETWFCRNGKRLTLDFLFSKCHTNRELLLFQLVSLEISFLILGFRQRHQIYNWKLN